VDESWKKSGFKQGEDHPVANVNWQDSVKFCEWLTGKDKMLGKIPANTQYRLPTDHEWSCAVGIGDREDPSAAPESKSGKIGDVFPWGTQWPPPAKAGNFTGSLKVDNFDYTSPAGSFAANGDGIHDLGGNVWEWCEDTYNAEESWRVLRGASWNILDGKPNATAPGCLEEECFPPALRTPAEPVAGDLRGEPDAFIALVRISGGRRPAFGPGGPIPEAIIERRQLALDGAGRAAKTQRRERCHGKS
jgi:hypothetical protein